MAESAKEQLKAWDRTLVWHAFTQMAEYEPLIIERAEGCVLFDIDGNVIRQESFHVDENWLVSQQLRHFADSLFDPEIKPLSTAKEHLLNVAAIESAYLSARTQMPEDLKLYGPALDIK